jgi:hypothetical protein
MIFRTVVVVGILGAGVGLTAACSDDASGGSSGGSSGGASGGSSGSSSSFNTCASSGKSGSTNTTKCTQAELDA